MTKLTKRSLLSAAVVCVLTGSAGVAQKAGDPIASAEVGGSGGNLEECVDRHRRCEGHDDGGAQGYERVDLHARCAGYARAGPDVL